MNSRICSIALVLLTACTWCTAATPERQIAAAAAALAANRIAANATDVQGHTLLRLALALDPDQERALLTRELLARSATVDQVACPISEPQLCSAMLKRADQLLDLDAGTKAEDRLALLYVRVCESYAPDHQGVIAALARCKARGYTEAIEALLTDPPAAVRPAHIPPDAVEYSGHWYRLQDGATSWADAAVKAAAARGILAAIDAPGEQHFLAGILAGKTAWIGAVRIDDAWHWLTGRPAPSIPWATGQPDNRYGDEYWTILTPAGVQDTRIKGNTPTAWFIVEWTEDPAPIGAGSTLAALYRRGAKETHHRAYRYFAYSLVWEEAALACQSMGGRLAVADGKHANAAISETAGDASIWIGGTDEARPGQWRWIDNSPFRWTNWGTDRQGNKMPDNAGGNQHWLSMWPDGTWNDANWNVRLPFVCEWPD